MSNIKVITQAPVAFQFWLRFSIHVLERSTLGRDVCECGVPSHVKLTQQLAENWAWKEARERMKVKTERKSKLSSI